MYHLQWAHATFDVTCFPEFLEAVDVALSALLINGIDLAITFLILVLVSDASL